MTIPEIHREALHYSPGLGIATVYRTLRNMLEQGTILQIGIPGEIPRYEDAHRSHHHFFQCRVCSRVFEVHECPADLHRMIPEGLNWRTMKCSCSAAARTAVGDRRLRIPRTRVDGTAYNFSFPRSRKLHDIQARLPGLIRNHPPNDFAQLSTLTKQPLGLWHEGFGNPQHQAAGSLGVKDHVHAQSVHV